MLWNCAERLIRVAVAAEFDEWVIVRQPSVWTRRVIPVLEMVLLVSKRRLRASGQEIPRGAPRRIR